MFAAQMLRKCTNGLDYSRLSIETINNDGAADRNVAGCLDVERHSVDCTLHLGRFGDGEFHNNRGTARTQVLELLIPSIGPAVIRRHLPST